MAVSPTYLDITRSIQPGMVIYPKNPEVVFERTQEATPETSQLTRLTLGTHTGTHIDAPAHIQAGAAGIFTYSLEQMVGPAVIVDLTEIDKVISAADLPSLSAERVLFKTRNSLNDVNVFDDDFVALNDSAAQALVEAGVKLVGLDALSIKKRGVKDKVHQILIDAGVIILEGLWLADVTAGEYELLCLPLKVDLDGAPVRAVLRPLA